MSPGDLTKSELVTILEIIESAQSCSAPEHYKKLLIKAAALVEADSCACGIVELCRDDLSEPMTVINGNYPDEMLSHYVSSRLYLKDPVVRYHLNFSSAKPWTEIFREVDDCEARQVINYARDFNLVHGVSGSVFMPEAGALAVFGFGGRKNKFARHHCGIVDILVPHLNISLLEVSGLRPRPAVDVPFHEAQAQI